MQSEAGSSILKLLRVTAACAGTVSFALLYASWRFHRIYEGGILLTKKSVEKTNSLPGLQKDDVEFLTSQILGYQESFRSDSMMLFGAGIAILGIFALILVAERKLAR